MALNFTKPCTDSSPETENVSEEDRFDIVQDKKEIEKQFISSSEIEKYTDKIEVFNPDSIVTFGSEAADEIAKASDGVLRSMSNTKLTDSGKMLNSLNTIMGKFDIGEIKENNGVFGKLFGNAQKQLEKILSKYNNMGKEVDAIYVQLKQYESEITQSNRTLKSMFDANVEHYHELVRYIAAGEKGCSELDEIITDKEVELKQTGNNEIQFELVQLKQSLSMLEQRILDLRAAESIAMQSIPMIKAMEFSNLNLVRKINSAFIVTLPVFKQALAQAMLLKRQKIQAEAMQALDKRTNEMLLRNAHNTAEQSKMIAQMTSGSSIQIETLETSWKTILDGIEETKNLQEQARSKRAEDTARLKVLKDEFNNKFAMPNTTANV